MIEKSIRDWLNAVAETRTVQPIIGGSTIIATDVGVARKENQDRIGALQVQPAENNMPPFMCIAVSDGMGGMKNGAECATLTLSAFFSHLIESRESDAQARIKSATFYANKAVSDYARGSGGATLSAVLVERTGVVQYVNVGDSRIYVAMNNAPHLERVTVDDTLKDAFGGIGNELVQFIGVGSSIVPRVGTLSKNTQNVFLTSDGAHFVGQDLLDRIIGNASDLLRAVERVTALARWLGGTDNASIAAISLPEIIAQLRQPSPSAAALWCGRAKLQIVYVRELAAQAEPQQPQGHNTNRSADTPERSKPRKKSKKDKKHPEAAQLEIKIGSSDDSSDASDS